MECELAKKIQNLRVEAGLTQSELAIMIGTEVAVISKYEDPSYNNHSVSILVKLAKAFKKKLRIEVFPLTSEASA